MDLQEIYKGRTANDKTGTPARQAADIINNNFKTLKDAVVKIQNPDGVLKRGNVETDGLNVEVEADAFEWQIDQQQFLDNPAYSTVLDAAASGYYRKDLLLGNNTGGYNIFKGDEDPTSATEPNLIPVGTVKLAVIDVYGGEIMGWIPDLIEKEDAANKQNSLDHDGTGTKFSTTDAVNAGLLLKADIASPIFTGVVTAPTFTGELIGNASSASILQTSRTINGVAFNGSTNITINAVDSTARIASSEKGQANGVATLDGNGIILTTQLPSYVDDVLEFLNLASFPNPGETGKIYIALDTNKTYRWSGSTYIYITSGAVDSVAGKTGVVLLVKADVGLGNVDNTSDLLKPISTATQTALDSKVGGSGTANYVSKFTASGTIGNSQIFDNGTNIGIGDTNPLNKASIMLGGTSGAIDYALNLTKTNIADNNGSSVGILLSTEAGGSSFGKVAIIHERTASFARGRLHLAVNNTADGSTPTLSDSKLTISQIGNVGIGTLNPTEKLEVNGNIKANNIPTIGSYTPTFVAGTNVVSVNSAVCKYVKIDSVVTIYFRFTVNLTAAANASNFTATFPVAYPKNSGDTPVFSGSWFGNTGPTTGAISSVNSTLTTFEVLIRATGNTNTFLTLDGIITYSI